MASAASVEVAELIGEALLEGGIDRRRRGAAAARVGCGERDQRTATAVATPRPSEADGVRERPRQAVEALSIGDASGSWLPYWSMKYW